MKLLAIDGNSILNRAFYGIKLLSNKNGQYTNAIYGFINILFRLVENENPDGVAVAFDLHAPTFRHKKYDGYKQGRKPMPDELRSQFPLIKEWLTLAGYFVIEKEGYEADDILGTLAAACENSGNTCVIATGDRDSFQLISDSTKVLLSATKQGHPEIITYTPDVLFEKYGLTPHQMIDLKAVMGDTSDKIPGVPGIGEKGATDLIKMFGSLDSIYENIDSKYIKDGVRNKLIAGKESAYLSRFLGTICKEVPIDTNIENYRFASIKENKLSLLMTKLELFKQMQHMNLSPAKTEQTEAEKTSVVLEQFCDFSFGKITHVYFDETGCAIFSDGKVTSTDLKDSRFCEFLESESKKCIYDSKNFYKLCHSHGIALKGVVFDTVLAAYLVNPSASAYDVNRLAAEYFVSEPDCSNELDGVLKNAAMLEGINQKLYDTLKEHGQLKLLETIEIPLARVLAKMEAVGVKIEIDEIRKMGDELAQRIEQLQNSIYKSVGWEFNLNSPKQLGEALFERLGLPAKKKTSRGYSTSAEVLEELRNTHESVEMLLEYRQLSKLKSTYCDALPLAVKEDGRIHSTFNQTETRTGRISSLEPNLQNIPVRREEGRKLRRFFTAKDGYVLCDADYSQIELRVLAAIADDSNMISAFQSGKDIHTATAAQVFGMPEDMITSELRSRAKAVNFGIVYGIGAFSLAKDIGVTRKEADAYIKSYLTVYSGVDRYMKNIIESARESGYVTTLFGRRRYLPELKNSNRLMQAFGERVARNAPIQGTAADIIKIAMIKVQNRLEKESLDAQLILQVHDELIVECKEEIKDTVCAILKEEMENAADLKVKLIADVNFGKSWYDAKG